MELENIIEYFEGLEEYPPTLIAAGALLGVFSLWLTLHLLTRNADVQRSGKLLTLLAVVLIYIALPVFSYAVYFVLQIFEIDVIELTPSTGLLLSLLCLLVPITAVIKFVYGCKFGRALYLALGYVILVWILALAIAFGLGFIFSIVNEAITF